MNHVQPQENGITLKTNVYVKPQLLTGTELLVSAQKIPSALNVFHAQPQEDGISLQTNVSAHHRQLSGMELNVLAQQKHTDLNA